MKLATKIIFLSFNIFAIHAELLIVKKISMGFSELGAVDERNYDEIAHVLLNYQWPMTISNNSLTQQEQNALFTNQSYAEENFIRQKLQMINPDYDVIFIPTCLFELFILKQINDKFITPFVKNSHRFLNPLEIAISTWTERIEIKSPAHAMYEEYNHVNDLFYIYSHAYFYCNNLLLHALFKQYPILQKSLGGLELSQAIEEQSQTILDWLLQDKLSVPRYNGEFRLQKDTIDSISQDNKIIIQAMLFEYVARLENKGLLLRGSKDIDVTINSKNEAITVLGNSLGSLTIFPKNRNYDEKPRSLSFGNSLFAGFVFDLGACAYTFLNQHNGYGLFIDKKDYIQHKSNRLFFISPLASIAALFGRGEFFHSRATTANPAEGAYVEGILGQNKLKPLIITRNSLHHAQLFSRYLADNMYIISQEGRDLSSLTPEELAVYEQKKVEQSNQLKDNQKQLSNYYSAVQTLDPFISKIKRDKHMDTLLNSLSEKFEILD